MPVNILVADDSVTMRRILEITFAGEDAQVTTVDSGDAAVSNSLSSVGSIMRDPLALRSSRNFFLLGAENSLPNLTGLSIRSFL